MTVLVFTHGEGDDDPVPLIKVLKDEALVRDCGTVVLLRDLLTVSVSSGKCSPNVNIDPKWKL